MPWKTIHNIRATYTRKTKTRTHSTHELIFGGNFFACLALNWQATGSFFVFFVCFFWRAVVIEMLCGHWTNYLFWTIHIKHTHTQRENFFFNSAANEGFCRKRRLPFSLKRSSKYCLCGKSQHDTVTLKHVPSWIAVATSNIHRKTSQEQK